jgi:hypothetical protein
MPNRALCCVTAPYADRYVEPVSEVVPHRRDRGAAAGHANVNDRVLVVDPATVLASYRR